MAPVMSTDAVTAYEALLKAFSTDARYEIEILPSSIAPPDGQLIMVDEECIGVPKAVLVQAFLVARSQFMSGIGTAEISNINLYNSSSVILLFDPEHLTAANYRKKRIIDMAEKGSTNLSEAYTQEMHFLNSILTSPLHRQSKSPTLWFHRWWLMNQLLPQTQDYESLFTSEMWAIMKSAERHPNNYYAWQYGRKFLLGLLKLENCNQPLPILQKVHDLINVWCLSNPSDTSGWTFLAFVLSNVPTDPSTSSKVIESVMGFASKTAWKKEALWVFLRDIASDESILPSKERARLYAQIHDFVESSMGQLDPDEKAEIPSMQRRRLWRLPVI